MAKTALCSVLALVSPSPRFRKQPVLLSRSRDWNWKKREGGREGGTLERKRKRGNGRARAMKVKACHGCRWLVPPSHSSVTHSPHTALLTHTPPHRHTHTHTHTETGSRTPYFQFFTSPRTHPSCFVASLGTFIRNLHLTSRSPKFRQGHQCTATVRWIRSGTKRRLGTFRWLSDQEWPLLWKQVGDHLTRPKWVK